MNVKSYDLVHNFGRLLYLLPILNDPVFKIMTYGREINPSNINLINRIPNQKNIVFTGCSNNLLSRIDIGTNWKVVYNAIPFDNYILQRDFVDEAPLIFLGRIERIKGLHTAIKVAKATNNNLIIAGNVSPLFEEREYFNNEIWPLIDGVGVRYVGPLSDTEKNIHLRSSKALLFPIEWNEPFGMVMVESMACGTPVIAFNLGSVDEVIDDGITGFKVSNLREMIEAVDNLESIDRTTCRNHAESRFSVEVIANDYLTIF